MTIEVGTYTGQTYDVQKTFNSQHTFDSITLKDDCSVQDPVILVRATTENGKKDLLTATYAYIPNFGRYYYVKDSHSRRNDLVELQLHSDPLKSFADKIYEQSAVIERSASKSVYTSGLEDSDAYKYADEHTVLKKLVTSDGFTKSGSYVMLTAGPSAAT